MKKARTEKVTLKKEVDGLFKAEPSRGKINYCHFTFT